jgi:hypothetical protein
VCCTCFCTPHPTERDATRDPARPLPAPRTRPFHTSPRCEKRPGAELVISVSSGWPQAPLHDMLRMVSPPLHAMSPLCMMGMIPHAWGPAGRMCADAGGNSSTQHSREGLYLPPSSPLSPLLPPPSPSLFSVRGQAVTSGARAGFVRGILSARAPPNLQNSQRINSQRGGRPGRPCRSLWRPLVLSPPSLGFGSVRDREGLSLFSGIGAGTAIASRGGRSIAPIPTLLGDRCRYSDSLSGRS